MTHKYYFLQHEMSKSICIIIINQTTVNILVVLYYYITVLVCLKKSG